MYMRLMPDTVEYCEAGHDGLSPFTRERRKESRHRYTRLLAACVVMHWGSTVERGGGMVYMMSGQGASGPSPPRRIMPKHSKSLLRSPLRSSLSPPLDVSSSHPATS